MATKAQKGNMKNFLRIGVFCFSIILIFDYLYIIDGCSDDLSGHYYLSQGHSIENRLPRKNIIFPKIVSYSYDDDFIVACQKPKREWSASSFYSEKERNGMKPYQENTTETMAMKEKYADSIFRTDPYFIKLFSRKVNYWIIVIKNDQMYGPLTKGEYLNARRKLCVPEGVKLKDEFE
jgi:hypothetical protein